MDYLKKVTDFLDAKSVDYEVMQHEVAYTAQELAAAQHVPGKRFVKTVIVEGPEGFIMCVLPAIHNIDFDKLRSATGVEELKLATEQDVANLFPDCEVGAEPPFGYWSGLPVFMDKGLQEIDSMVFNAGTHIDTIRMNIDDYRRMENPMMADIGVHIPVS